MKTALKTKTINLKALSHFRDSNLNATRSETSYYNPNAGGHILVSVQSTRVQNPSSQEFTFKVDASLL